LFRSIVSEMIIKRKTKIVRVGGVPIGGDNPIVVQSMTKTDTADVRATVSQIQGLAQAGCRIVRVAVKDMGAASALSAIVKGSPVPIIADIHFDRRLALAAMDAGVSGIRINPGNIGSEKKLFEIIQRARQDDVAIRIGVNSGSLKKDLLKKYGGPCPEALVESALRSAALITGWGYTNIKLSLKSTSVLDTIAAYRLVSERTDLPLHVGVTEAGTVLRGAIKSSVGIGILLAEGIGDTIRVSLAGDPLSEVLCANTILSSLGLGKRGVDVIVCPTCGRTSMDIVSIAQEVEARLIGYDLPITVAVMGCEVNGPGEAREADIGVCGGKKYGLLFKKGKIIRKLAEAEIVDALISEIDAMAVTQPK
jgi:(E)-4-hydroxy-3-methylbut-2-enyl-diphosphate synthase